MKTAVLLPLSVSASELSICRIFHPPRFQYLSPTPCVLNMVLLVFADHGNLLITNLRLS